MGIPKLWGKNPVGGEHGFVYSHIQTVYYNWAKKVLLKTKLDEMDEAIAKNAEAIAEKLVTNEAFNAALASYVTKAMMSNTDVNSQDKIPTSALVHSLQSQITALNNETIPALKSGVDSLLKKGYFLEYTTNTAGVVKIGQLWLCIGLQTSAPAIGAAIGYKQNLQSTVLSISLGGTSGMVANSNNSGTFCFYYNGTGANVYNYLYRIA